MSLKTADAEPQQVSILGIPIHVVAMDGAVDWVERCVGASSPGGGSTAIITTPNPEIIAAAQGDPALRRILAGADLSVPDGIGVVLAARILGLPIRQRVAGIELMQALTARAAEAGWKVYLLGARPGVAARAARQLEQRHPDLQLVGTHHGYFTPGDETEARIMAELQRLRPQLLFVGMGAQRELAWLWQRRHQLPAVAAMGVGGSFDVISGELRRAPAWMQRLGLEWLFRLLQEPGRIGRLAALPVFLLSVVAERLGLAAR